MPPPLLRNVFGTKKQPSIFGARKVGILDVVFLRHLYNGSPAIWDPDSPAEHLTKRYAKRKTQVRPKFFWSLLNVKRFLTIFGKKVFFSEPTRDAIFGSMSAFPDLCYALQIC